MTSAPESVPAGLRLGPATRVLWRGAGSVHLELGTRAVVVDGLPPEAVAALAGRAAPGTAGAAEPDQLAGLAADGFLWPPPGPESSDWTGDLRLRPPAARLAPELGALAARHGDRARDVLQARRRSTVAVCGAHAVTAHLAAVLAAAGVGRVVCVAGGTTRLAHAMPGGVRPDDEGADLDDAVAAAIRRAAPEVRLPAVAALDPAADVPDLTVLVVSGPVDQQRRAALHAANAAHLLLDLGAEHAAVGPLVLPGLTSCLHCADLYRRDRDPAWPVLAVQLACPTVRGTAVPVALGTAAVGIAALQVLGYLDGDDPATVDGSLEFVLPDWRVRRRTRPPHPDCDCALRA